MLSELERVVLEDLEYLSEVWAKERIREADLRHASGILRRLLIDNGGTLFRLANQRAAKIEVLAPVNSKTVAALKGVCELYLCGNTSVGGMHLANIVMRRGSGPSLATPAGEDVDARQTLSLGAFKNQVCALWCGLEITRQDVIKFVANKLGGVHYDPTRGDVKHIALDRIAELKVGNGKLSAVHFTILATGRFLAESVSVRQLIETLAAEREQDGV